MSYDKNGCGMQKVKPKFSFFLEGTTVSLGTEWCHMLK